MTVTRNLKLPQLRTELRKKRTLIKKPRKGGGGAAILWKDVRVLGLGQDTAATPREAEVRWGEKSSRAVSSGLEDEASQSSSEHSAVGSGENLRGGHPAPGPAVEIIVVKDRTKRPLRVVRRSTKTRQKATAPRKGAKKIMTKAQEATPEKRQAPVVLLRGKKVRTVGPAGALAAALQQELGVHGDIKKAQDEYSQVSSPQQGSRAQPHAGAGHGQATGVSSYPSTYLGPLDSSTHINSLIAQYTQPEQRQEARGQHWQGLWPPWVPELGRYDGSQISRQASSRSEPWDVDKHPMNLPTIGVELASPLGAARSSEAPEQADLPEQFGLPEELGWLPAAALAGSALTEALKEPEAGHEDQVGSWLLDCPALGWEPLEWPSLSEEGVKSSSYQPSEPKVEGAVALSHLEEEPDARLGWASGEDACDQLGKGLEETASAASSTPCTEASVPIIEKLDREMWGSISGDLFGGRVDEVLSLGLVQ